MYKLANCLAVEVERWKGMGGGSSCIQMRLQGAAHQWHNSSPEQTVLWAMAKSSLANMVLFPFQN